MKKTALTRSIPFWLLLALSLATIAIGGRLVWENTATMQRTLLDGSATNIEVYVGQAWITSGSAILAAGIVGLLITLGLAAAKALIPASPVVAGKTDGNAQHSGSPASPASAPESMSATDAAGEPEARPATATEDEADQNGSSGSTATATKISVK